MTLVRCRDCAHFLPDKIGFGQGLGRCKKYEDYKAKNPGEAALKQALLKLGQIPDERGLMMEMFWGGELIDRRCEKFEEKKRNEFKRASERKNENRRMAYATGNFEHSRQVRS